MRGAGQRDHNCAQDVIRAEQYVIVPESQYVPSSCFKPCSTSQIVSSVLDMLSTIELDDQLALNACKVGEKRANWMLPSKLESEKPAIA